MLRRVLLRSVAAVCLPLPLFGQSGSGTCARRTEIPMESPTAYRARDDGARCEGLFIQPVAGNTRLLLRGYHLGRPAYSLDAARTLTIEVVGAPARGGTLIARSMRPRQLYQMDTRALDAAGRFVWSTDVLRHPSVRLVPSELAVLYTAPVADAMENPYVWPVRVNGEGGQAVPETPFVTLESESLLVGIVVRIERPGTRELVHRATFERPFPADNPIHVDLPVPTPGTYEVSLRAVHSSGAQTETRFTAYVPVASRAQRRD